MYITLLSSLRFSRLAGLVGLAEVAHDPNSLREYSHSGGGALVYIYIYICT